MIPLKLTLRNFMCYRDNVPALDLENIHVACLCGQNGHGKTAILDSITWALWGESRARTQDELVHQGTTDMAVEIEFLARGQRHRVIRKYSRGAGARNNTTLLEHHVASDDNFQPVTGNTVRETEGKIKDLLHMDYETFVNTAFLLQGHADIFTTSTPAKRKERLADVLDLSYYEAIEEKAKERSQTHLETIRELDSTIGLRHQEVAQKENLELRLSDVTTIVHRVSKKTEAERTNVDQLRSDMDIFKKSKDQLDMLTRRLGTARSEMGGINNQLDSHLRKLTLYEETLSNEDTINRQFGQLQEIKKELDRLYQVSLKTNELNQKRLHIEQSIALRRERVVASLKQIQDEITLQLEPKVNRLPKVEKEMQSVIGAQTNLDKIDEELEVKRNAREEASVNARLLEQSCASLRTQMAETRKKFDILGQGEPQCPVCKQPLGAEAQMHLQREYETAGKEAKLQYETSESDLRKITIRYERLSKEISSKEFQLSRERKELQSAIASHQRDIVESQEAIPILELAKVQLAEKQAELDGTGKSTSETENLSYIEAEILDLGYSRQAHEKAQQDVKDLESSAETYRKLIEAKKEIPSEQEAVQRLNQMLEDREKEIDEYSRRTTELEVTIGNFSDVEPRFAITLSRYESLEKEKNARLVDKGIIKEKLAEISRTKGEIDNLERRRQKAAEKRSIYDELAVSFGKNGIQALIIETAIPQLQDDANELLGRLTDNKMFLKLQLTEGRRERRTGLPSEELEIKISDEVGTRSYETFSGGEAFRINFALRIALSKLLARRSGAPLPILFIDEGFGSQDAVGQERLKEAIQSIQEDFQKIIAITHVEEIKESFPVRIEVTKTEYGTTFEIT